MTPIDRDLWEPSPSTGWRATYAIMHVETPDGGCHV
jgi:hypothetical protein